MPTSLPTTRPATTPQNSDDDIERRSVSASSTTPALASAKTGRITYATYGANERCSRSLIEIDSRSWRPAAAA